ncbi:MAG: DegV family protein [Candidatus Izemoplasmatales bacterium]|nr:DegV family protein [Candidatus Izemoplasmatales bacterium]
MEKIGLMIDSTTLTRTNLLDYGFIKVAQLNVTVDGVQYKENELTTEIMQENLRTGKKMITSQPSPGEILEIYNQFFDEGYTNVLVVTLSEKISGTFQSALIAKTMFDKPMELSVHAPQVASFGVANSVNVIADAIAANQGFIEIVDLYYRIFKNTDLLFTLSNLMHLFRGGRLSRIQALLGTVLRIKPIIKMIDGKLHLIKKERTNNACYDFFMTIIADYSSKYETVYLDIIDLNQEEWAKKIKAEVEAAHKNVHIHMTNFVSPVFFVHLGDRGFGIAIAGI